jgi:hypothetical protein
MRRVTALLVALVWWPAAVHGECIGLSARQALTSPKVAVVFFGRAIEIQPPASRGEQQVTFAVERVWKGKVPAKLTIHASFGMDAANFESGKRYFVFAHILTEPERAALAVRPTDGPVLGVGLCGDGSQSEEAAAWTGLRQSLGRGHRPK